MSTQYEVQMQGKMSIFMRKPAFCICQNTVAFATKIVLSLFFINQKFQASSYLVWLVLVPVGFLMTQLK